ncbi:STAS domain-containing protein [Streptomyces sp. NBC_01142]|uniref:STAS domain-containing protein n=1 Tax=Streptomyces sp. NBC_01142 TaxID=2975865 RepID=UPI00224D5E93|nr:STAS domain-containing protein [Streptomyces sp. NBC_01142]MCX4818922.1 STAS domain-containing protein [Streptomyces sp. NBC_01142]
MSCGPRGSLLGVDTTQPIVVRIAGRVTPGDVPRLCDELSARVPDAAAPEVICDVGALTHADLAAVNAVARLRLTARRLGCPIRLRNAGPELRALLDLVGLGEVAQGRPVEPGRIRKASPTPPPRPPCSAGPEDRTAGTSASCPGTS